MALRVETPQASLIRPGQLPIATANLQVPDVGGPLRRVGEMLMHKDDEDARAKQALADQVAGRTKAGEAFVGKLPDGTYARVPLPDGSPEYQKAYYDGVQLKQAAQFEADVTKQFSDIQLRTDITPEQKDQLMREAANAALETAPPDQRASYSAWLNGEVTRRTVTMATEEHKKQEQLVVEGLATTIESDVDQGISLSASGGDPGQQIGRIRTAYDTLVRMKRMSPEEAKARSEQAIQTIRANGYNGDIIRLMLDGQVSPDDVDEFAARLEDDAADKLIDIGGIKTSSRFGRQLFKDGAVRKEMAVQLRKAAADHAARLQSYAKTRAFVDQFTYLNTLEGRYGALPANMRDDAETMIANIMVNARPFEDPKGGALLTDALQRFKIAPKPLVKELVAMVNSGDPTQIDKAINVFQTMTTLQNRWGDSIGEQIRADMDEESRNLLDAYASARETGATPADAKLAVKALTGPDALTMESAIDAWNAAEKAANPNEKDRKGFNTTFWEKWTERFGAESFHHEAEAMFRRAYRTNLALNSDPQKSFDRAFEKTAQLFTKSPIYTRGVAKTGLGDLTNPPGFEPSRTSLFGGPASGAEYEWVEGFVRDAVSDNLGRIAFDGGFTKEQLDRMMTAPEGSWFTQSTPDFLGRSMTLEPTDTNRTSPQFNIRLWDENGNDMGYLMVTGEDGTERPMLIDPLAQRRILTQKHSLMESRKAIETEAANQRRQLKMRTIAGGVDNWMPNGKLLELQGDDAAFQEFLTTQPPETEQKYRIEDMVIRQGLERALKRLETEGGVEPGSGGATGGGGAALMTPRAAGYDVTKAAVSAVEAVVPDGTGGLFMLRTAAQESNFGAAPGSFRPTGDRGIFQVNTGSAFVEVKRRIEAGEGRVAQAARLLKERGVVDLSTVTEDDLDKPVVSAAVARLYYLIHDAPIPKDVEGQALYWKRYYNTEAGAGSPSQFVASAAKVTDDAMTGVASPLDRAGKGMVISATTGAELPANFRAMDPKAQAAFLDLSAAFGQPLRITPHGGRQADRRKSTSQHHDGLAMDAYIADMPDAEKTRLLALAIQQGATGIGGYAQGDGKGTLHIDFRKGGGKGPGGMALWWRARPGVDGSWSDGPAWFRAGIQQGLAARGGA